MATKIETYIQFKPSPPFCLKEKVTFGDEQEIFLFTIQAWKDFKVFMVKIEAIYIQHDSCVELQIGQETTHCVKFTANKPKVVHILVVDVDKVMQNQGNFCLIVELRKNDEQN